MSITEFIQRYKEEISKRTMKLLIMEAASVRNPYIVMTVSLPQLQRLQKTIKEMRCGNVTFLKNDKLLKTSNFDDSEEPAIFELAYVIENEYFTLLFIYMP